MQINSEVECCCGQVIVAVFPWSSDEAPDLKCANCGRWHYYRFDINIFVPATLTNVGPGD